jgi:hypothetical protein
MNKVKELIRENSPWFNKTFRNYPEIKNTNEFQKVEYLKISQETFKINKLNIIIVLLINLLIFIAIIFIVKKCIYQFTSNNLFGLFICLFLFSLIFNRLIRHLKNIFEINIDEAQLIIGGKKYCWTDINETYLAYELQNRTTIFHLIIEKKNHEFEKFDLINFKLNDNSFCSLIEHFKTKNKTTETSINGGLK